MTKMEKVEFLTTAVNSQGFPKNRSYPEIAVVGRSNVGKSALLNHLFKTKGFVKTSSTPGKTRAIQFFLTDDTLLFADLPGYGYAQVSKGEKKKWQELIESYLETHPSLILFLLDCRRTPTQEDLMMLEWIRANNISTLAIITKVDKLKQSERVKQERLISQFLGEIPYILYSVPKNRGRSPLLAQIREVLFPCS
ncbi:MAG: putative GTP-binding protein EngB [Chlamydiae bacterium]|nr:putative GTP-binding protein EngB [Chlamydiota bacterium]